MGIADAEHEEYGNDGGTQVVTQLSCDLMHKSIEVRLQAGSRMRQVHGDRETVTEYATCNYGLNPAFQGAMHESGFRVAGVDDTGEARLVDLEGHPFFVASLYLPQWATEPDEPHPLLRAFVDAAAAHEPAARGGTPAW